MPMALVMNRGPQSWQCRARDATRKSWLLKNVIFVHWLQLYCGHRHACTYPSIQYTDSAIQSPSEGKAKAGSWLMRLALIRALDIGVTRLAPRSAWVRRQADPSLVTRHSLRSH